MSNFMTIKMPEHEKLRFKNWVNSLNAETQTKVKMTVVGTLLTMERRAKQEVALRATDMGFLKNSIKSALSPDHLGGSVYTYRHYAPYVEFGTGDYASVFVPTLEPELQTYAATFKGKKKVKGVKARPYLFPAWRLAVKELEAKLKDLGFEKK